MSEEEKGFVIRDKRNFTAEGEAKPKTEVPEEEKKVEGDAVEQKGETPPDAGMPLPEIDFASFVLSMSSSVLLHFGQVPDPFTKKTERNLPMAKQTIDILGIMQEKTKGNLSKDEEELISNLLHDLRLRYVEESKKS
jgi:hypothetical protein